MIRRTLRFVSAALVLLLVVALSFLTVAAFNVTNVADLPPPWLLSMLPALVVVATAAALLVGLLRQCSYIPPWSTRTSYATDNGMLSGPPLAFPLLR